MADWLHWFVNINPLKIGASRGCHILIWRLLVAVSEWKWSNYVRIPTSLWSSPQIQDPIRIQSLKASATGCVSNRSVKMVLFRVAGGKLGRIFSKLGLLLLVAASLSLVSGQQGILSLNYTVQHWCHTPQTVCTEVCRTTVYTDISWACHSVAIFLFLTCRWCYSKPSRSNHTKWQLCGLWWYHVHFTWCML